MNVETRKEQLKSVRAAAKLVLGRKVRIKSDYDLRAPQADKYDDASDFEGWTVFINRRGSLAHVLRGGCEWILIRIPGLNLKDTSENYKRRVMAAKLYEGLS